MPCECGFINVFVQPGCKLTKSLLYKPPPFSLCWGMAGEKILVVDDEPNILKLVSFILTSRGYKVVEAALGAEAIQKAKSEKPDLIILDVMMPKMDGFEAAKKIKSDAATKSVPILMLSSKAQFEDKMKGIDSGAMDYITKPFDKEELLEKVRECLE